jgi:hypothetical protein
MAEEEERNNLIKEFESVTNIDAERSRYYLEAAEWDIQVVLHVFYQVIVFSVYCCKKITAKLFNLLAI